MHTRTRVLLTLSLVLVASMAGFPNPAGAADPDKYTWTTGVVVIGQVGNTHVQPLAFNDSDEAQTIVLRIRNDVTGSVIVEATRTNVPPRTSAEMDLVDTVCIDGIGSLCGIGSVVVEVVAATDSVVPSGAAGGSSSSHPLLYTLVGPNGLGPHGEVLAQADRLDASITAVEGGLGASMAALESAIGGQLDALGASMDDELASMTAGLGSALDALADQLSARLDGIDSGLAEVTSSLTEVHSALADLHEAEEQRASPSPAASVSTPSDPGASADGLAATGTGWLVFGLASGAVLTGVGGSVARLARRRA